MSWYGLETLYSSMVKDLKSRNDVLVVFIHWTLTREGWRCTGSGDRKDGTGSELLPASWNSDTSVYQLNYQDTDDSHYTLKVVMVGESALCSLLRIQDNKNTDTTVHLQNYINEDVSSYEAGFKDKDGLRTKIEDLLQIFKTKQGSSGGTNDKTQPQNPEVDPLRAGPSYDPLRSGRRPRLDEGPPGWDGVGPPRIGGSDLDPLGGMHGGGMLMDPMHGGRPMNPRWDPVGPTGPLGGDPLGGGPLGGPLGGGRLGGGGGRRNYGDAMRPPDWDNMFM
ncbi:proteasome inhibitor PI31 subunit [Eurytemora carolleeae]|uniref:proteasome inhibitor PI31 subunit n=1 Tax=Eurytemora carolleeae TaxID=1294199 RepID=UPI000C78D173|nr:proteasome inhibitor PI31 subunit [Eurytemora carolleeae]|eukprot:XP_023345938.1 proteasome inhibitor PI31 subunit-like [Eurytemora affinis]